MARGRRDKRGSKGESDIYRRLKGKDINFELANSAFREGSLYYKKKEFSKGEIVEENLRKKQSNLTYFREYIKKITDEE